MASTRRADVTPEQLDAAIESIAVTGRYTAACEILNMTSQAWCMWRKSDKVVEARAKKAMGRRWENSDHVKRALANELATSALRVGVKETTIVEKEVLDGDNNRVTVVETRTVHKGAPFKLIERYLVPETEELGILFAMAEQGLLSKKQLAQVENAYAQYKAAIVASLRPVGTDTEEGSEAAPQDQQATAAAAIKELLTTITPDVSEEVD